MKKAFTLIELLIVIAIIGILATIVITYALPAIGKSRDASALAKVNAVQKIAAMCVSGDKAPTAPTLTSAGVPNPLTTPICSTLLTAGNWPSLSGMKSSNGQLWKWQAVGPTGMTFTSTDFRIIAFANTTAAPDPLKDPTITCTFSGCSKVNF